MITVTPGRPRRPAPFQIALAMVALLAQPAASWATTPVPQPPPDARAECLEHPNGNCVADLAFALQVAGGNPITAAAVSTGLAEAGHFRQARELLEGMRPDGTVWRTSRDKALRVLALRQVAETALRQPDEVASLSGLDPFVPGPDQRGGSDLPYYDVAQDLLGRRPYNIALRNSDAVVRMDRQRGRITLDAVLQRWKAEIVRQPAQRQARQWATYASIAIDLDDRTEAEAALRHAEQSDRSFDQTSGLWLRLGQPALALAALDAAERPPQPSALAGVLKVMRSQEVPLQEAIPLIRRAIASYDSMPREMPDMDGARELLGTVGRYGAGDEARALSDRLIVITRARSELPWSALTKVAAGLIDAGETARARTVLAQVQSRLPWFGDLRRWASMDLAVQLHRSGDDAAFVAVMGGLGTGDQGRVWFDLFTDPHFSTDTPEALLAQAMNGQTDFTRISLAAAMGNHLLKQGRQVQANAVAAWFVRTVPDMSLDAPGDLPRALLFALRAGNRPAAAVLFRKAVVTTLDDSSIAPLRLAALAADWHSSEVASSSPSSR